MILVDTSVIVDWLRGKDARLRALMPTLPAVICGVTHAEVLHGARDPAHRQRLITDLGTFPLLSIPDSLWVTVGDHLAILRARGFTLPFSDVVIATVALAHNIELWTRDSHFANIQLAIPALKLFVEPP
jgi:predicted nucleic acid-binding protein